jgi:hypothetical protein
MSYDDSEPTIVDRAIIAFEPVAIPINRAPGATGLKRTRIFEAIAKNELTVRKRGKATLVEIAELRRWISTFPTRGRMPDSSTATAA